MPAFFKIKRCFVLSSALLVLVAGCQKDGVEKQQITALQTKVAELLEQQKNDQDRFQRIERQLTDLRERSEARAVVRKINKSVVTGPNSDFKALFTKKNETEYAFKKGALKTLLNDVENLNRQVRIVPSFKAGEQEGFKIFGIRRGSLVHAIGLKNGDVVQKMNGHVVNNPEKLIEVYETILKKASSIHIGLRRSGRDLQIRLLEESPQNAKQ